MSSEKGDASWTKQSNTRFTSESTAELQGYLGQLT